MVLSVQVDLATQSYRKTVDGRPAEPTSRYSAIAGARLLGSANVELHHSDGHDRVLRGDARARKPKHAGLSV
jgi:hypothetical protein